MEAAMKPRVLRALPSGGEVMSVSDVDEIKQNQHEVLRVLSLVREDVASLKASAVAQVEQTKLFWSKDWAELTSWRHDVDDRVNRLEKATSSSRGSIVTIKWVIGTALVAATVIVAVVATVISALHS